MFIRIRDNKLYDWAGYKYAEDCQEIDINYSTFEPEKYEVIDGVLTDISNTPDYIAEQEAKEKEAQNIEIQKQLDELDKKRIRAICEGGEKEQGKTWLAYYNEQAISLRAQLQD